jgi:hypothetical protein
MDVEKVAQNVTNLGRLFPPKIPLLLKNSPNGKTLPKLVTLVAVIAMRAPNLTQEDQLWKSPALPLKIRLG